MIVGNSVIQDRAENEAKNDVVVDEAKSVSKTQLYLPQTH